MTTTMLIILLALLPAADHPTVHITWERTPSTSWCVTGHVGSDREAGSFRFCPTADGGMLDCPPCFECPDISLWANEVTPVAAFVQCMRGPGEPAPHACIMAFDYDRDRDIDLADWAAMLDEGKH